MLKKKYLTAGKDVGAMLKYVAALNLIWIISHYVVFTFNYVLRLHLLYSTLDYSALDSTLLITDVITYVALLCFGRASYPPV